MHNPRNWLTRQSMNTFETHNPLCALENAPTDRNTGTKSIVNPQAELGEHPGLVTLDCGDGRHGRGSDLLYN